MMNKSIITSICFILIVCACHKPYSSAVINSESKLQNTRCEDKYWVPENLNTVSNLINMKFVYIKPGTFLMGIPAGYSGGIGGKNPSHLVTISTGYLLQLTEVTQEQWFLVTGETPSHFKKCGKCCPVENVSWDDVQDFIILLNLFDDDYDYRLPTEAEWEYAARAGIDGPYSFGPCLTSFHANIRQNYGRTETSTQCKSGKSYGRPIPVASLEMNSWGLYDMYGNVAEWCQDFFGKRPVLHKHVIDPKGPVKGSARVIRGGSWDSAATACQSGYAGRSLQDNRNYFTGLRLVAMPVTKDH